MTNKKVIAILSAFFFLTLIQPAGSKTVAYRFTDELSIEVPALETITGESLEFAAAYGEKHSFLPMAAGLNPPKIERVFFSLDYKINRLGDAYHPVINRTVIEKNRESANTRFAPSRINAFKRAKSTGRKVEAKELPGQMMPYPINESVMLLLIGSGLILLAGLGMRTYRKIISNL